MPSHWAYGSQFAIFRSCSKYLPIIHHFQRIISAFVEFYVGHISCLLFQHFKDFTALLTWLCVFWQDFRLYTFLCKIFSPLPVYPLRFPLWICFLLSQCACSCGCRHLVFILLCVLCNSGSCFHPCHWFWNVLLLNFQKTVHLVLSSLPGILNVSM